MKRDLDLIREILFEVEKRPDWLVITSDAASPTPEENKFNYHIYLLCDSGLMAQTAGGHFRLTNQGHDYLDAIRSDTIWEKTKGGAAKVGGLTLGMMKDLALAYVKQEALDKLGVEL